MSDENTEKNTRNIKKPSKALITGIVLLIALGAVGIIKYFSQFQSTDDAYVETTTVSVSPKISGQIVKVLVEDNQQVKAGQVVAVIDKIDYRVKLDQAKAEYERTLLNQTNAKANLNAANSNIDLARRDVERYTNLYQAGAVSKQTLDKAITNLETMQANQTTAVQSVLSSNSTKGAKVADADLNVLAAKKHQAELALSYTDIIAPIDGTVSNKKVEVGMMVQPGSPLFTIVPNDVWVVANYKETQIGKMKEGMPVEIKIDTYPNKVFKGKIDSFQRASGAKSSLFPPENAVGSFVKIVQRIPVKIVFTEKIDPKQYKIIPGMSVVPKVLLTK